MTDAAQHTAGLGGDYARELSVAAQLAAETGPLVMRYFHGDDLTVEMKPGDEPVTVADRAASELIVAGMSRAFADDVIISEENADDLRRLTAKRVWYIDPIDGTKAFIKHREGFCVMIGLTVDHTPVVGALYAPISRRLFVAARDCGAWLITEDGERQRMHASTIDDPRDIRLVASANNRTETIDQVKSALGINTELNIGSVGLKLALIALGERDLYVNPGSKCKSWDTCGPEIVLAEAGGKLTDVFGEPLRYDERDMVRSRGLIATNGRVHEAVVAKTAPLFPR